MNGTTRAQLKAAIDARIRVLVADDAKRPGQSGTCSGCGCDYDAHTTGCATCWSRQRNRAKPSRQAEYQRRYLQRPEVQIRRRELHRLRQQQRRAEARARREELAA